MKQQERDRNSHPTSNAHTWSSAALYRLACGLSTYVLMANATTTSSSGNNAWMILIGSDLGLPDNPFVPLTVLGLLSGAGFGSPPCKRPYTATWQVQKDD